MNSNELFLFNLKIMACGKFHKSTKAGFFKNLWNGVKKAGKWTIENAPTLINAGAQAAQIYNQFH